MLAPRATSSERPRTAMIEPITQTGNGSQLVPLGSMCGRCAKVWAMVTRA